MTPQSALEIAAHLLRTEPAFSRNKHYDAFGHAEFRAAVRIYRRVQALVNDVNASAADSTIAITDGVWRGAPAKCLTLHGPRVRMTTWLSMPIYALVVQHCAPLHSVAGFGPAPHQPLAS